MKVGLNFEEISGYVKGHYGVCPQLKKVDGKTLEVSYAPGRFIPAIKLVAKIEAVRKDVVCMSYDCSKAVGLIIAGLVCHLEGKMPEGIEINTEDKRINLFLERINEIDKVMTCLQLNDICINEDGIEISVILK